MISIQQWRDEHRKKLSAVLKSIDLGELERNVGLIYDLERARQLWGAQGFGGGGVKIYPLLENFSEGSTGVYAKMQACYKDIADNTLPRAKAYEEYKQFVVRFAKLMVLVRAFEDLKGSKPFNIEQSKKIIGGALSVLNPDNKQEVSDAIDAYNMTTNKVPLMKKLVEVIKISAAAFDKLIAETHQKNIQEVYKYYVSKGIYSSLKKTREFATKDKPDGRRLASSMRSDSPDRLKEYKEAIDKLSQLANIAVVSGHNEDKRVCDALHSMLFEQ